MCNSQHEVDVVGFDFEGASDPTINFISKSFIRIFRSINFPICSVVKNNGLLISFNQLFLYLSEFWIMKLSWSFHNANWNKTGKVS